MMRLFHDLSRLLAFYSLLRWPQTPCQPHMACACHVAYRSSASYFLLAPATCEHAMAPWCAALCLQWCSDVRLCNCSSGQLCDNLLSRPAVEKMKAALKMYPVSSNLDVSSKCSKHQGFLASQWEWFIQFRLLSSSCPSSL